MSRDRRKIGIGEGVSGGREAEREGRDGVVKQKGRREEEDSEGGV
jgi:hypothetical protein